MAQLNGKVAIVTGGGRGIGRAEALALADEGAAVVVNDLGGAFSGDGAADSGPADEVVAQIIAAGGRAVANTTDIADWDAVSEIVQTAVKAFGRLDIIVNNAGISRFGTIDQISRKDWDRTIAVNLSGTAALCHWAAVHWRKAGPEAGRRIINTSSGVGLHPPAGNPMYASSKAAVAALTQALSVELAELGVRANCVAPVGRSRISEFVMTELMGHPEFIKPPAEGFDRLAPENVAAVVAYLASPSCAFTGRIFGIVGDSLTLYDGWQVSRDYDNGAQRWTSQALAAALADAPLQQRGLAQGGGGVDPLVAPDDAVLAALAAIEKA